LERSRDRLHRSDPKFFGGNVPRLWPCRPTGRASRVRMASTSTRQAGWGGVVPHRDSRTCGSVSTTRCCGCRGREPQDGPSVSRWPAPAGAMPAWLRRDRQASAATASTCTRRWSLKGHLRPPTGGTPGARLPQRRFPGSGRGGGIGLRRAGGAADANRITPEHFDELRAHCLSEQEIDGGVTLAAAVRTFYLSALGAEQDDACAQANDLLELVELRPVR